MSPPVQPRPAVSTTPPTTPPAASPAAPPAAKPALPPPTTLTPSATSDGFTREPWSFNPVRPQIPGQDGAPKLWATPGGLNGISTQPGAAPTTPAPASKPTDGAASSYAQKLGDIFQVSPEAFAKGQLPTTGAMTDQQKDKLVDATKDYLLDAKIGTLAGPAADRVKSALTAQGVDPKTVEGKSLKELGAGVGDKIAGDVSKGLKENPAAAAPLVAAGLAAAGGAAGAGANGRGLTVPAIPIRVGPVTVTGSGSVQPGFKQWEAKVEAKGTIPLKNGASLSLSGGVNGGNSGSGPSVNRAQAGATYTGPLGNNGRVTVTGTAAIDKSGPSGSATATIEPKSGGPKIGIQGGADSKQQNATIGIGGTF